jgi:hypothetical protein
VLGYFVMFHSCAGLDGAVVGQTVVWVYGVVACAAVVAAAGDFVAVDVAVFGVGWKLA